MHGKIRRAYQDLEGVAYDFDLLKNEFERTLKQLLDMFASVKRDGSRGSLLASIFLLDDDPERLNNFKENLSKLRRLYETIAPEPVLFNYLGDYVWLIGINEAYNQFVNRGKTDLSSYEAKTKQLIIDRVLLKNLATTIKIFDINKDYLGNIEKEKYSEDEKVREMGKALEFHIKQNLGANLIYDTLSERLEKILKGQERAMKLKELQGLVKEVVEVDERAREIGITNEEYAILNAIKKYSNVAEKMIMPFVKKLLDYIKPKIFGGWQRKVKDVNEVEETIFEKCFERFSKELVPRDTSRLSDEIMKLVMKYNV